jgi:hypothetical protein
MLQIDNTLISSDLLDKNFCCDLKKCKGACCVKGDAGAPLTDDEVKLLPGIIDNIKPYLRKEGIRAVEEQGTHVIDEENETVTPLVNGAECAYVVFERGIAYCGIEKAYNAGKISFRKPISCHLYPVRIRKYEKFFAVNYDTWSICSPARDRGDNLKLAVYKFVEDALIRKFGEKWFKRLMIAEETLPKK